MRDCSPYPETKAWWDTQPHAWESIRKNAQSPQIVMENFEKFLKSLPAKPVLVSHPASFDFSFVHWYALVFLKQLPFFKAGFDIGSFAMAVIDVPFTKSGRQFWPKELNQTKHKHTHNPLDDAYGHMEAFVNLLRLWSSNRPKSSK